MDELMTRYEMIYKLKIGCAAVRVYGVYGMAILG
jgi:hypothetical protein